MTDNTENKNLSEPIDELINSGSEILGGIAGGAIGFFTGGPEGALLGGATGPMITRTFRKLGGEFIHRMLGNREKERIGATIAYAAEKIKQNKEAGQEIRQDDFFQEQPNERSAGEEIVEGVLLVAQREPQEQKLRFYGNLLANIAFHPEIDRAMANLLIKLGERISYRQICLLNLFVNKDNFNLRQEDYRNVENIGADRAALFQEIYYLYNQGMINKSGEAMLGLLALKPRSMNVQGTGSMLYTLMELWNVETQDLNDIANLLS